MEKFLSAFIQTWVVLECFPGGKKKLQGHRFLNASGVVFLCVCVCVSVNEGKI
jgi:hypothetical protein